MPEVSWECHKEGDAWVYMGDELTKYIESHYEFQLDSCDYADAGHQNFFRIYFKWMAVQDLRSGFIRYLRRCATSLPVINKQNSAKEITGWTETNPATLPAGENCSICLCQFDEEEAYERETIVHLSKCGPHYFHLSCITQCYAPPNGSDQTLVHGHLKCPICSFIYGVRTGTMPFGTMKISKHQKSLPGYEGHGTIQIIYSFPPGVQGPQHPNPGQLYSGTVRNCFLPDTEEGNVVLKKLQLAFERRITFIIGTSITSGRSNTVVWNGIHHKTNIRGGPSCYGYPDPTYLNRVSQELANVGIF